MTKVLFVVTAADRWTLNDGTVHPSGYWAEELAVPYRIFTEAGWDLTVATPTARHRRSISSASASPGECRGSAAM